MRPHCKVLVFLDVAKKSVIISSLSKKHEMKALKKRMMVRVRVLFGDRTLASLQEFRK